MKTGREGRVPDPDDEVVGTDVRELLAADDERAPADLHAVVAAMAREAQGLPQDASVPARALPRRQRLVPIAAVLALSVGVVPLLVRDAPTGPERVAPESAPAPAAEADRAAVVAGAGTGREAPVAADSVASEAPAAEAEPAPAASARARAAMRVGTPRDGARRIIERLRARGVDAALESYAAWRASWPEADLAELVGDASGDELARLHEAAARRGLPPLSPAP